MPNSVKPNTVVNVVADLFFIQSYCSYFFKIFNTDIKIKVMSWQIGDYFQVLIKNGKNKARSYGTQEKIIKGLKLQKYVTGSNHSSI